MLLSLMLAFFLGKEEASMVLSGLFLEAAFDFSSIWLWSCCVVRSKWPVSPVRLSFSICGKCGCVNPIAAFEFLVVFGTANLPFISSRLRLVPP